MSTLPKMLHPSTLPGVHASTVHVPPDVHVSTRPRGPRIHDAYLSTCHV